MAKELWTLVLYLFELSWVMLSSVVTFWQKNFGKHNSGEILLCLMQRIWRERNMHTIDSATGVFFFFFFISNNFIKKKATHVHKTYTKGTNYNES